MLCLHETHLPEALINVSIVLRYISYCEMTFTSGKRVSCIYSIGEPMLWFIDLTVTKHSTRFSEFMAIFFRRKRKKTKILEVRHFCMI